MSRSDANVLKKESRTVGKT